MNTTSILQEADNLVEGSRQSDYGDPVENFNRVSEIAQAAFGIAITPADVCRVMIALKLSREANRHKRDNLVDLCAYVEILKRILQGEQSEQ